MEQEVAKKWRIGNFAATKLKVDVSEKSVGDIKLMNYVLLLRTRFLELGSSCLMSHY